MNKNKLSLLTILSLVLVVTYCDSNYFGRLLTRNAGNAPTDGNVKVTPIPVPDGGDTTKDYFAVTNSWTQTNNSAFIPADIIFSFDRSGSMNDNIAAVKSSLKGWLDTLDSLGLPNYCVGVLSSVTTSAGGVIQGANGHDCFCRRDANGTVLMTSAQISSNFADAVAASAVGTGSGDSEAGIYSVTKAITTKLASNQSSGECFSNDKALVVFMASDENDDSNAGRGTTVNFCTGSVTLTDGSSINLGTTPVEFDNSFSLYAGASGYQTTNISANTYTGGDDSNICSEVKQRLAHYVDPTPVSGKYVNVISPNTLFDAIVAYNNTLPTYGNVITYPTGANSAFVPTTNAHPVSEGPGHGYLEFANLMGQDPINIDDAVPANQTAFNTKMDVIAHDLVTQLSFLRSFNLSATVCSTELDSVVVKINGATLPTTKWTLNSAHNKVTIVPTVTFHQNDAVDIAFTKCI